MSKLSRIVLDAQKLRELKAVRLQDIMKKLERNPVYLILEDIYDTYNVGGLFRLADALAIKRLYLCGITETPPNHKIKKASIGTYKIVPWRYKETAIDAINEIKEELKEKNIIPKVMAIEQAENSVSLFKVKYHFPVIFILGNETSGVKKETLKQVDKVVEIPMYGVNKSLNVIVAGAVAMFAAVRQVK